MSLARTMGWLQIEGGRGLLAVADLDTMFIDATIIVFVVLCVSARSQVKRNLPYFSFVLGIPLVTDALLAYVVTNLGTIVRLRLMSAVPLWMAAAAMMADWGGVGRGGGGRHPP